MNAKRSFLIFCSLLDFTIFDWTPPYLDTKFAKFLEFSKIQEKPLSHGSNGPHKGGNLPLSFEKMVEGHSVYDTYNMNPKPKPIRSDQTQSTIR